MKGGESYVYQIEAWGLQICSFQLAFGQRGEEVGWVVARSSNCLIIGTIFLEGGKEIASVTSGFSADAKGAKESRFPTFEGLFGCLQDFIFVVNVTEVFIEANNNIGSIFILHFCPKRYYQVRRN